MTTYTPQTWHDTPATDTPISAARLAVMEAGIAAAMPVITGDLPNPADAESTQSAGTVTVVNGGFATTIASGIEAASMGSSPGRLGLTGTTTTSLVQAATGYYGPGWKDDAAGAAIGATSITAPFSVNVWVSGSRYIEFQTGNMGYTAITPYFAYRVWIDGKRKTDLPVTTGLGGAGSPNTIKIDFGVGNTKPHLVRLDLSGMVLEKVYVEPAGQVWAAKPSPRVFVLGCSLTGSAVSGTNTGYEQGTWLYRWANMVGITDYWNGGESGTGPNTIAGNWKNFKTRATTHVIPAAPDVVIIDTWTNDFSVRTGAQIAADLATTIDTIKAGRPNVKIIVGGGIDLAGGGDTAAMSTIDNTNVKPMCITKGAAFYSPVTGEIVGFDGTLLSTTRPWFTAANIGIYRSTVDNFHPNDAGHEYIAFLMRNVWSRVWNLGG